MGRVAEWFGLSTREATTPSTRSTPAAIVEAMRTRTISDQAAIALPTVFRCVSLLATTAASLPLVAVQGNAPATLPEYLRRPDAYNDGAARMRAIVQHLVVSQAFRGAGYLYATPVGADSWDLQPIDPRRVGVTLTGDLRTYTLDAEPVDVARRYSTRANTAGLVVVPHLILPGRPDPVGPIGAARAAIGDYALTDAYGTGVLTGGTHSGGRLESDQDLPPATAERYSRAWMDNAAAGADRSIPVLGSGLRYVNDVIDPADAQWIEARSFNAQEVARLFGVPPRYLGLPSGDASTYATARDNDAAFLRYGVAAFTGPIEDAFDAITPPGRGAADELRIRFDFDALLRPTPADRATLYASAIAAGWMTVDEARRAENLPPIGGSPT